MQTNELNNGVTLPQLGLGVLDINDFTVCEETVLNALEVGYRLIDTAASYGNEQAVGSALKKSNVSREDIFVSTKVWVQDFGYENTISAVESSLEKLDIDYIDLVMLHQQLGDYYGSWRALEKLYEDGKIRAIGVSNFFPDRLMDLYVNARVKPAVNQIECHPFFQRKFDFSVMEELGVTPMAWAPFAEGGHDIWNNELLKGIADKHNKTVAQVALRFNLQRNAIVIPKTVHKERLIENISVWDFELDKDDMEQIATLDTNHSEIIDQLDVETVKFLNQHKIHD